MIQQRYAYFDSDDETSSGEEETDDSRLWDCESVLSTLSNLSNRPGKISKIKVVGKPKQKELPKVVEEEEGGENEAGDDDDNSVIELPDVITERKRGETAEEKKARKASVKEMRRVCRQMKRRARKCTKAKPRSYLENSRLLILNLGRGTNGFEVRRSRKARLSGWAARA